MAAADIVAVVAPQFAGHANLTTAIELAEARVDTESIAGGLYAQAVAYLAAHILEIGARGSGSGTSGLTLAGPVSSVTTGGLSVSAGGGTSGWWGRAALESTPYGREYLGMLANGPGALPIWVR
jgi:hypothetical protein